MARHTITNELKVGILVIVCLAVLAGFLYKTGSLDFSKEGYELQVLFSRVGGVQVSAPVRVAGVEVGRVTDISLCCEEDTKVILTLWLKEGTRVRKDAVAHITALGLMGEKYIEISAGSSDAPFVNGGDKICGEDPMQLDALARKGETIAETLQETLEHIKILAENSNTVVADNKEKIDSLFSNLELTSQNFKEFSEDVKRHPWKLLSKGD